VNVTDLRARYAVREEPLKTERRVELVVVALAGTALLLLLLVIGRFLSSAAVRPVEPAPDSLRVAELTKPGAVTSQQSLLVQARPLFWDSRRPLDPLPDAGELAAAQRERANAAPAAALKQLEVSGILENGDGSRVIVRIKDEQRRLSLGDDIEGWTLVEVRPGEVVFASGGQRDIRRLTPSPMVAATTPQPADGSGSGAASTEATDEAAEQPQQQTEQVEERLTLGGR
jgi:hypothetical protein